MHTYCPVTGELSYGRKPLLPQTSCYLFPANREKTQQLISKHVYSFHYSETPTLSESLTSMNISSSEVSWVVEAQMG